MVVHQLAPWLQSSKNKIFHLKQQQTLTHALLLMGQDGGGHHHLANDCASDILCQKPVESGACGHCHSCQLMQANTHPDFHILDGRSDTIKVDQIREVLKKVTTKPQIGTNKVVFLAQASSMNINASNAILKALEEPPEETFFILTSDANASLLPTIRSRCMLMKLPSPTEEESSAWLGTLSTEKNLSDLLWVTKEPFTLFDLATSDKDVIYQTMPENLYLYLTGQSNVDDFLAKLDNKNSLDFAKALLAIMHQCICYSTGHAVPNLDKLQQCFDLILNQLGIHHLMLSFQRLQKLVSDMGKTHLNMQLQLRAELLFLSGRS